MLKVTQSALAAHMAADSHAMLFLAPLPQLWTAHLTSEPMAPQTRQLGALLQKLQAAKTPCRIHPVRRDVAARMRFARHRVARPAVSSLRLGVAWLALHVGLAAHTVAGMHSSVAQDPTVPVMSGLTAALMCHPYPLWQTVHPRIVSRAICRRRLVVARTTLRKAVAARLLAGIQTFLGLAWQVRSELTSTRAHQRGALSARVHAQRTAEGKAPPQNDPDETPPAAQPPRGGLLAFPATHSRPPTVGATTVQKRLAAHLWARSQSFVPPAAVAEFRTVHLTSAPRTRAMVRQRHLPLAPRAAQHPFAGRPAPQQIRLPPGHCRVDPLQRPLAAQAWAVLREEAPRDSSESRRPASEVLLPRPVRPQQRSGLTGGLKQRPGIAW